MGSAFLFVTWSGGGNVNPVLAMTAGLAERGHRVRVLGSHDVASRFDAIGVAFTARDPATEWDAGAAAHDVVAEVDRQPADAVVVDYMMPGALCGAEKAGRPTAAFVHTLYGAMFLNGDLPTMSMAAGLDAVNDVRARLGLGSVERLAGLLDQARLVLVTSPADLDAPLDPLPANVTYAGPVLEGVDPAIDAPVADIVVSMGTTPMDEGPVIERVLEAAGGRTTLVTVGAHLDPAAFAGAVGYLPHGAVLPHARLMVNHAGLGGVLAALAHGVPQLCIPLGRDQPANAAAVERVGAGRSLPPDASVDEFRAAIDDLVTDGRYRAAAQQMAAAIAGYGDRWAVALEALAAG